MTDGKEPINLGFRNNCNHMITSYEILKESVTKLVTKGTLDKSDTADLNSGLLYVTHLNDIYRCGIHAPSNGYIPVTIT